jgi:hypothetical protein
VAPTLQSSLLTETWNNGAGTLTSNCSSSLKYHVMNVETVGFDSFNVKFSVHHDHSKWAVTTSTNGNILDHMNMFVDFYSSIDESQEAGINVADAVKITCIGDINRQSEQFKRSGGTVCFSNNTNVWSLYSKLVTSIVSCPKCGS